MKKLYFLLILLIAFMSNAQIVNIPNANFKARLLQSSTSTNVAYNAVGTRIKIDANSDGNIQVSEALAVYKLDVNTRSITDLTGIQSFTNVTELICYGNQLTSLDVTALTTLKTLNCRNNVLTSINVSGLTTLESLTCNSNQLADISITGLTNLKTYVCSSNLLTNLNNINSFTNLTTLSCAGNQLTSLNVSGLVNLKELGCGDNALGSIDVSTLVNLEKLFVGEMGLTTLNLSNNNNLISLSCNDNQLTSIDVSNKTNLKNLTVYNNTLLTTLNISNCFNIEAVNAYNCAITSLDISNRPNLTSLFLNTNQLTTLNITNDIALERLELYGNLLQNLDLTSLTNLEIAYLGKNPWTNLNINGLANLTELELSELSLAGFPLNATNMPGLTSLYLLQTDKTPVGNFNYSLLPALTWITCRETQMTDFIPANFPVGLENISCEKNLFATLDLTRFTNLEGIAFWNNPVSGFTLGTHPNLYLFYAGNNNLTSIDVSSITSLQAFACNNSPVLTSINVKNGAAETLSFGTCPNLQYICADEAQLASIETQSVGYGYTNCTVNTYCSFEPGGVTYTIQGTNRYDANNNGCDNGDGNLPNLKLAFTQGTTTGNLIPDTTGNYTNDVVVGTHTVTPVIENPSYFTVAPTTFNVTFPTQASPFTQNFCIAPVGTHNDLEIAIFPVNAARPGFDARYVIIYKNKGTHVQSGSVTLAFDDAVLDLVATNPNFNSQSTNSLQWNFTNLQPFESRAINVRMNLNSTEETPPLASGNTLNYNVIVSGAADETPIDNSISFNQNVVNAFDPNDKTCVEGTIVAPSTAGNYVHYVIRFENTGNSNAENVIVKDAIDMTKFDIASLIPLSGSHSFVTRISNTGKAEFIFENINLPFDDLNNDGYITFKIKTKSTLVEGDTFSNSASIYFDYNAPIVTLPYTTTLQTLGTDDFDFATYFSLHPNPTSNLLTIGRKESITVKTVEIYTMLGQLTLIITNAENSNTIDVSDLTTGTYFLKIKTEKGSVTTKFIKN